MRLAVIGRIPLLLLFVAIMTVSCVADEDQQSGDVASSDYQSAFLLTDELARVLDSITPVHTDGPEDADVLLVHVAGVPCENCSNSDSLVGEILNRLPGLIRSTVYQAQSNLESMTLINGYRLPPAPSASHVDSVLRWALGRAGP